MTTMQPLSVSEDTDSREVGKLLPLNYLADIDESVSQESIQVNLKKNREAILRSLDPLYPSLYGLLDHYELAEEFTSGSEKNRRKMAERLLSKIEQSGDYRQFLDYLEEDYDDEHTGHTYIISLLNGKQFGKMEVAKHIESETILKSITKKAGFVIDQLDTKGLLPYLKSNKLVTRNEEEEMSLEGKTCRDKATRLLALLKTKGPTAHHIFLHNCLAEKDANHFHLYTLLTESNSANTRKRKILDLSLISAPPTKVPRPLDPLQLPEGIVAQRYLIKISGIRRNYSNAEPDILKTQLESEVKSAANPLEARIAFCLEMSYFCAADIKQTKLIVFRAKEMMKKLDGCNKQVLEVRYRLILGRCYRICGKNDKARKHLDNAFAILYVQNIERGEDAILANYFKACSLMKSVDKVDMVVKCLKNAIDIAQKQDYGMDIAHFCKIRCAQVYIGVSADNPVSYKEIISPSSLKDAKGLLKDLEDNHYSDMNPAAKCFYLIACSDVYRLAGNVDEAREYAKQAENTAMSKYHISLVEKRQILLQES